ncbi:uncharacterized protein [Misgurnus anguillicaudatus]|uniref:uncharacterized protein n=1 Tax=Misgurnus anguillicaudatus TaxID=75329 RepID=UPI003CCFC395
MDPRFKDKIEDSTAVWVRIKEKLFAANRSEQPRVDCGQEVVQLNEERRNQREDSEEEDNHEPPPCKKAIKSPLEELFAADDEL